VSRNLTPDKETGLANRTDEDIKRVLRSGVFPDGRPISHAAMPWPQFSNWSDEDLYAVVVYLRHIKPVRHEIPPPAPGNASAVVPGALEVVYGTDAGKK
ncbi:MAG: c-type cytochrome, partial [Rhodospirillaceae bacterium]